MATTSILRQLPVCIALHMSRLDYYIHILFLPLGFGWCLAALALLQLPLWAAYVIYKQEEGFTIFDVTIAIIN